MKTLTVDHENNGEAFWPALTEYDVIHMAVLSDEAKAAAARLAESGTDAVTLSDEAAEELLAWFATLPGWTGGPEYAPHPVMVTSH